MLVSRKGKAGLSSPEVIQTEILEGATVVDKMLVLEVLISSDLWVKGISVRSSPPPHRLSTLLELYRVMV